MADLRIQAFEKQLLVLSQQVTELKEGLKAAQAAQAEFRGVIQSMQASIEALNADVEEIVNGLETLAADAEEEDDDESSDDDEPEEPIPGFEVADSGDLIVDEAKLDEWTVSQMIQVGAYLPTPLDLRPYEAQPREMRRVLYEALEAYDVRPPQPVASPITRLTVAAELSGMPLAVPMGDDGLPTRSPILGKPAFFHVPRNLWRTAPPFDQLHKTAERFRIEMVRTQAWHCKSFNCHDCVEQNKNLNRIIQCATAEVRRGNEHFSFVVQDDERPLITEAVDSLMAELDEASHKV